MPRFMIDVAPVRLLPLTHTATIPVDYLDDMGHMNVMWYTHLFSVAMGGMFQLIGLTQQHVEQHLGGSFALECHTRYLSEVRAGQVIRIHSRMIGRTLKRYHVMHFMLNEHKEDVAATFEVVGAYIDMRTRRMAPIPETIAATLDSLLEQHRQLDWQPPLCGTMQP